MKNRFYSLDAITKNDAYYYVIFGMRSNGKTFAVLNRGLDDYINGKGQLGIIRRWKEDFKGKKGQQYFNNFIFNEINGNMIEKKTHGKYNSVYYYSMRWFLQKTDEKGEVKARDESPFAIAFALTDEEHDKSSAYPLITNILFDEFITRNEYLPDEFITFTNVLSTIIRARDNVKIFMCGNTINKYCPYFNEMGLYKVKTMKEGSIDLYTYGNSNLKVAVEYSDFPAKMKKSDVYFAFDNPKLKMITEGSWEIDIYPHCPFRYLPKEILFTYFISFDRQWFQCEIISHEEALITFIHRKTTHLKDIDTALVYQDEYNPLMNYSRNITKPATKMQEKIYNFFRIDKVFYQDNEVGEAIRNYLGWCGSK